MEIEDKLLRFRREEQLKQMKEAESLKPAPETFKSKFKRYFDKFWTYGVKSDDSVADTDTNDADKPKRQQPLRPPLVQQVENDAKVDETQRLVYTRADYLKLFFKFVLWASLYGVFLKLEFGAVYFVCSSLVLIYLNTGKRNRGSLSAYSVFNPNVERLQGTLTSEELEKNMMGGFIR